MDRRVAIIAIVLCVILAFLLRGRGSNIIVQEADAPPIIVKGGDVTNYELPPIAGGTELGGYKGGNKPWDWMQTTNLLCGCDTGFKQQIIIEPPPPPPQRPNISYVFMTPPPLNLPPPVTIPTYTPPPAIAYTPPPPPIIQAASRPSFRWAWDGLQRVVILDNGVKLLAGLSNRKFQLLNDGSIIYAGFQYWPA